MRKLRALGVVEAGILQGFEGGLDRVIGAQLVRYVGGEVAADGFQVVEWVRSLMTAHFPPHGREMSLSWRASGRSG